MVYYITSNCSGLVTVLETFYGAMDAYMHGTIKGLPHLNSLFTSLGHNWSSIAILEQWSSSSKFPELVIAINHNTHSQTAKHHFMSP